MELTLTLTFACCHCRSAVTTVLCCRGAGLDDPHDDPVAAVTVPCPTCDRMCRLLFEPHRGTVRDVLPCVPSQPIPEPSRN